MGKFFDTIPDVVVRQIENQHMFWVATAPLSVEGHVNVSSKGLEGTFEWWMTGRSGNETISRLREPGNGRITVFFNTFEGPPSIIRLFGKGVVYEYGSAEYEELLPPEKRKPGSRSIIKVDVHRLGRHAATPYLIITLLDIGRSLSRLEQVENAEDENERKKGVGLRLY